MKIKVYHSGEFYREIPTFSIEHFLMRLEGSLDYEHFNYDVNITQSGGSAYIYLESEADAERFIDNMQR